MTNTRELLERAANAAGYVFIDYTKKGFGLVANHRWKKWNPIESDADAFRLMVDCSLCVDMWDEMDTMQCAVYSSPTASADIKVSGSWGLAGGKDTAREVVRKTIVRAAAQLQETDQ